MCICELFSCDTMIVPENIMAALSVLWLLDGENRNAMTDAWDISYYDNRNNLNAIGDENA